MGKSLSVLLHPVQVLIIFYYRAYVYNNLFSGIVFTLAAFRV